MTSSSVSQRALEKGVRACVRAYLRPFKSFQPHALRGLSLLVVAAVPSSSSCSVATTFDDCADPSSSGAGCCGSGSPPTASIFCIAHRRQPCPEWVCGECGEERELAWMRYCSSAGVTKSYQIAIPGTGVDTVLSLVIPTIPSDVCVFDANSVIALLSAAAKFGLQLRPPLSF